MYLKKAQAALKGKRVAEQQLGIVCNLAKGARQLLSLPAKRASRSDAQLADFIRAWTFQRIACGPRARGEDLGKQNIAAELVATAVLELQRRAFDDMLNQAEARAAARAAAGDANLRDESIVPHMKSMCFLGCRLMWDEACQNLRPLLSKRASPGSSTAGSHLAIDAMTLAYRLTCVCIREDAATGAFVTVQRWEPWHTPVRIMPRCTADHILHALLASMPFDLSAPLDRSKILRACNYVVLVFLCDSASSNLRALRQLALYSMAGGSFSSPRCVSSTRTTLCGACSWTPSASQAFCTVFRRCCV